MSNSIKQIGDALKHFGEMLSNRTEFMDDGFHSYNDLYYQRAVLFAALCHAYPDKAWRSLKHADGTMFDGGWFICGIETPLGQYTYHYKDNHWDLFYFCKTLDNAPEWDGHSESDVFRLLKLHEYNNVSSSQ